MHVSLSKPTSLLRPATAKSCRHAARVLVLSVIAAASSTAVLAQTDTQISETWRATSRLGYAPTAASAQAAMANPKNWALRQIDEAYAASRKAPNIPPELARFNEPISNLVTYYHEENTVRADVRKQVAESFAKAKQEGKEPEKVNARSPKDFRRDMQEMPITWRIMACSDPAMEQPLLARMTEFWFNHFNVFAKGTARQFVGNYIVSTVRPNALGKFEDLLLATAQHPAMLFYLNQAKSNVKGLNENYARELMELHTLGVNSGYSQADVRELARVLTGWTVDMKPGGGFRFVEKLHDKGTKKLLGQTIQPNGMKEGEDVIRMLARHPATAQRISLRLAQTFVSDSPPKALIDSLAATFVATQGDIRAVLKTLVASPEFWRTENTLFKTPLDFACSALTATGGTKDEREIKQTTAFLAQAGQPMHGWLTPDGYKTSSATWMAPEALTRRADYAIQVGAKSAVPTYLLPFISASNRERITREAPDTRTGLILASPDFMKK